MKLRDIAHARSGDKGDISNISVIAHRMEDFALLREAVTPSVVKGRLEGIVKGEVVRHGPAGGGGVAQSQAGDRHGFDADGAGWHYPSHTLGGRAVKLRDIAHARSGDKGDISNISVIAHRMEDFALLREAVTPSVVKGHLEGIVKGEVVRHELPALGALNFVLQDALGGNKLWAHWPGGGRGENQ